MAFYLPSSLSVVLSRDSGRESADKINDGDGWRHLRRGIMRGHGQDVHGAWER